MSITQRLSKESIDFLESAIPGFSNMSEDDQVAALQTNIETLQREVAQEQKNIEREKLIEEGSEDIPIQAQAGGLDGLSLATPKQRTQTAKAASYAIPIVTGIATAPLTGAGIIPTVGAIGANIGAESLGKYMRGENPIPTKTDVAIEGVAGGLPYGLGKIPKVTSAINKVPLPVMEKLLTRRKEIKDVLKNRAEIVQDLFNKVKKATGAKEEQYRNKLNTLMKAAEKEDVSLKGAIDQLELRKAKLYRSRKGASEITPEIAKIDEQIDEIIGAATGFDTEAIKYLKESGNWEKYRNKYLKYNKKVGASPEEAVNVKRALQEKAKFDQLGEAGNSGYAKAQRAVTEALESNEATKPISEMQKRHSAYLRLKDDPQFNKFKKIEDFEAMIQNVGRESPRYKKLTDYSRGLDKALGTDIEKVGSDIYASTYLDPNLRNAIQPIQTGAVNQIPATAKSFLGEKGKIIGDIVQSPAFMRAALPAYSAGYKYRKLPLPIIEASEELTDLSSGKPTDEQLRLLDEYIKERQRSINNGN